MLTRSVPLLLLTASAFLGGLAGCSEADTIAAEECDADAASPKHAAGDDGAAGSSAEASDEPTKPFAGPSPGRWMICWYSAGELFMSQHVDVVVDGSVVTMSTVQWPDQGWRGELSLEGTSTSATLTRFGPPNDYVFTGPLEVTFGPHGVSFTGFLNGPLSGPVEDGVFTCPAKG